MRFLGFLLTVLAAMLFREGLKDIPGLVRVLQEEGFRLQSGLHP